MDIVDGKRRRSKKAVRDDERSLKNYLESVIPDGSIRFVQVGSNDGVSSDPLKKFIIARQWVGLLIEPDPNRFDRLQMRYKDFDSVRTLNLAISNGASGLQKFYSLNPLIFRDKKTTPRWAKIGFF